VHNIENLSTISNAVEEKIATTSTAMALSKEVAIQSNEDTLEMSKNIREIIKYINDIEALSTANGTSALSIEEDLKRLVKVASLLQNSIDEFKS
jgi:methyl-accepting chemotaxis protein